MFRLLFLLLFVSVTPFAWCDSPQDQFTCMYFDDSAPLATSGEGDLPSAPSAITSAETDRELKETPVYSSSALPAQPIEPIVPRKEKFAWGKALRESAIFLGIQHSVLIGIQPWTRYELRGPLVKDYFRSIKGIRSWDDGDPFIDNYIGHPIQGALTGYIQVQNDPRGKRQQFGMHKEYWKSRLKAMAFSAAYSTQFEIGPFSEASIGNSGGKSYIDHRGKLTTGMGYVDLVVTPIGGMGWQVMEDILDRHISERVERAGHRKWANFFRVALNPARTAANLLRLKKPWHRDWKDGDAVARRKPKENGRTVAAVR